MSSQKEAGLETEKDESIFLFSRRPSE